MSRGGAAVAQLFPTGGTLSRAQWRTRHRVIQTVLAAHVPALLALGTARGDAVPHLLLELLAPVLALLVARAERLPVLVRSAAASLGLSACSAVLVHLTGGSTEAHFHFFVVVGAISLYEQWSVLGLTVAFVLVHHLALGAVDPGLVFDSPDARGTWAQLSVVHALAIAAQCVVALGHWRVHEQARATERLLAQQLLQQEAELQEGERRAQVNALAADVAHGLNTPVQYAADNARFLGSAVTELVALVRETRTALDGLPDACPEGLQALRDRHREHSGEWDGDELHRALVDCLAGLDEVACLVLQLQDAADRAGGVPPAPRRPRDPALASAVRG